jgi:hypothetical protein
MGYDRFLTFFFPPIHYILIILSFDSAVSATEIAVKEAVRRYIDTDMRLGSPGKC